MEIVDKRVETRPKNIKKELNEEETRQAILEQDRFFNDKRTQEKLERLKYLIVNDSNQKRLQNLFGDNMDVTPISTFEAMNAKTKFF